MVGVLIYICLNSQLKESLEILAGRLPALFVRTLPSPTNHTQIKACQRTNKASPRYRLYMRLGVYPPTTNEINSCSASSSVRNNPLLVILSSIIIKEGNNAAETKIKELSIFEQDYIKI